MNMKWYLPAQCQVIAADIVDCVPRQVLFVLEIVFAVTQLECKWPRLQQA